MLSYNMKPLRDILSNSLNYSVDLFIQEHKHLCLLLNPIHLFMFHDYIHHNITSPLSIQYSEEMLLLWLSTSHSYYELVLFHSHYPIINHIYHLIKLTLSIHNQYEYELLYSITMTITDKCLRLFISLLHKIS